MKYKGVERWQNLETGEIIETDSVTKEVRRSNFMITYITYMLDLFDLLGTKKMQVVKYIFKNMPTSTNTLVITTNELAEKSGVSKPVVIETLKLLESNGLITRRVGSLMINPKMLHKGSNQKEKYLLTQFKEFKE
ncbi:replication/maintenance protein RepL [uncultured Clostridium sp.]|uniref:replication/maintenance protein RepL n=1 Tax=uncultured Clostridium sp. TaxID=59620 RepID=UPI0025F9CDCD|nr:replication/maintenance protein RepL [uncultured Clostridium sp.]